MRTHIKVLGVFYLILGVLGLFGALATFGVIETASIMGASAEGETTFGFLSGFFGTVITYIMLMSSVMALIVGITLLKRIKWSRTLTIITSILSLISIPIGTIVGIYGLIIMFNEESKTILAN